MTTSDYRSVDSRSRALLWAGVAIILINTAACCAFCLLIRGPWWGTTIDCVGFTGCSVYAWRLCWRAEMQDA